MKKQDLKETELGQSHTARKWQSWDSIPLKESDVEGQAVLLQVREAALLSGGGVLGRA